MNNNNNVEFSVEYTCLPIRFNEWFYFTLKNNEHLSKKYNQ